MGPPTDPGPRAVPKFCKMVSPTPSIRSLVCKEKTRGAVHLILPLC
ncbi:unnamed protein product [Staurois parvus]|uniref:Uncharacterized protein n=1 Tax=Staurois parvus TaxID=386267 RepID=A0ABN9BV57_9NEOB|nr:unnamed protein product [Staurois parvus]